MGRGKRQIRTRKRKAGGNVSQAERSFIDHLGTTETVQDVKESSVSGVSTNEAGGGNAQAEERRRKRFAQQQVELRQFGQDAFHEKRFDRAVCYLERYVATLPALSVPLNRLSPEALRHIFAGKLGEADEQQADAVGKEADELQADAVCKEADEQQADAVGKEAGADELKEHDSSQSKEITEDPNRSVTVESAEAGGVSSSGSTPTVCQSEPAEKPTSAAEATTSDPPATADEPSTSGEPSDVVANGVGSSSVEMAKQDEKTGNSPSMDAFLAAMAELGDPFIRLRQAEPDELHARYELAVSRLNGDNTHNNLLKAVRELQELIMFLPKEVHLRVALADCYARLLEFGEAGRALRVALEADQSENREELETFLQSMRDVTTTDSAGFTATLSDSQLKPGEKKTQVELEEREFELEVPMEQLREHFMTLLRTTRKHCFSADFSSLHKAIDSAIFEEVSKLKCSDCQKMLHKFLEFNINPGDKKANLFFLHQQIACQVAYKIWRSIPTKSPVDFRPNSQKEKEEEPEKKEEEADQKKKGLMEDQSSFFNTLESFCVRDGLDFVASTGMESIDKMASCFQVQHHSHPNPTLSVALPFLTSAGLEHIAGLATVTCAKGEGVHVCQRLGAVADGADSSSSSSEPSDPVDWPRFVQSRLRAHELLEVQAAKNFTPKSGNDAAAADLPEEALRFEAKMAEVLGEETQKRLTRKEIELSVPVLLDYAKLMNFISGIPIRSLLMELVDQENADKYEIFTLDKILKDLPEVEPSSSAMVGLPVLDKDGKYEPIGLAAVIQNHEFYITRPSTDSDYSRDEVQRRLKVLEKNVVRMQVDYRAEVVKTAGDKFGELDSLMSHLQTRSLELTCHLRGFVYYMMDRRTVEEDILAQSGEDKFFPSAMSWFDRAQSRLTLGHSYLVAIISRVLMRQLESTCQSKSSTIVSLSDSEVASSLNGDATPSPSPADSNPVTADSNPVSVPPLDRPELSSAPSPRSDLKSVEPNPLPVNARFEKSIKQLYANDIIKLLEPAIKLLKTVKLSRQKNSMPCDEVRKIIKEAMESTPGLLEKRDEIIEKLKVTRLLIPFLSVNVPVNVLYQFHSAVLKFEPNDPKFKQFLTHERFGPSLSEFDILLRRLKWSDEVICVLVHSSYDNSVVAFPAVTGAGIAWPESRAAMYPLCAACKRDFGTSVCRACGVARYCSKICQNDAWTKHSTECKVWAQFAERQKMVVL